MPFGRELIAYCSWRGWNPVGGKLQNLAAELIRQDLPRGARLELRIWPARTGWMGKTSLNTRFRR